MKTGKLIAAALCAMAVSSPFANGDSKDILVSAAEAQPSAPKNPKPGMIFNGYNKSYMEIDKMPGALENAAAVATYLDKGENFVFPENIRQGVWEGFLNCRRAANCTIVVKQYTSFDSRGYVLFVNGKKVLSGQGEHAATVDLNAGFNHFKLFSQGAHNGRFPYVTLKPTGSTADPSPITPKNMFHDEKPAEEPIF